MAKKRGGLGRGLESLFEDVSPSFESDNKVETLPLREIEPDPGQPRKTFDDEALGELAASIAEHGLIQPIAVRPKAAGGYLIVAGERRWRACRMAGLTEAPVVVKDVTDEQAMELALVENLQREDLDPVEEAVGIHELMARCDLTQEQAARKLGKSRSALANSLRLLNLPEKRAGAAQGRLHHDRPRQGDPESAHGGIAGTGGPDDRRQRPECASGRSPVQEVGEAPKAPAEPAPIDTLPVEVEESLKEVLGSEVNVAYHGGKGKLTVHFYSDEQLKAFANLLGKYQQ